MRLFLVSAMIASVLIGGILIYINAPDPPGSKVVRLQPENANLVVLGKQIYIKNCAYCHGRDLKGQPGWRQPDELGYLPAPPHDDSGHSWHHADQLLFRITKYGTAKVIGQNYKSRMLGFQDVLTDDEIIAVLSFIKSTWPKSIKRRHDRINEATRIN